MKSMHTLSQVSDPKSTDISLLDCDAPHSSTFSRQASTEEKLLQQSQHLRYLVQETSMKGSMRRTAFLVTPQSASQVSAVMDQLRS